MKSSITKKKNKTKHNKSSLVEKVRLRETLNPANSRYSNHSTLLIYKHYNSHMHTHTHMHIHTLSRSLLTAQLKQRMRLGLWKRTTKKSLIFFILTHFNWHAPSILLIKLSERDNDIHISVFTKALMFVIHKSMYEISSL